ncbi:MAG: hypothetical protein AAF597_04490, partial [Bacteroidota bacterium]
MPENHLAIYEQELALGEGYLAAGENERAEIVFLELTSCLQEFLADGHLLLLEAQFGLARSIERKRDLELAQEYFQELLTTAQTLGHRDLEARLLIQLALIYEQSGAPELCLDYLLRAQKLVSVHGLRTCEPQLAVRLSSYHRIYADQDSARYYAERAIAVGKSVDIAGEQVVHIADSYLLLGMLTSSDGLAASNEVAEQASYYYSLAGNHFYGAAVMHNLTETALRAHKATDARVYNRRAFAIARKINDRSSGYFKLLSELHGHASRIQTMLGQADSSMYHLTLKAEFEVKGTEQYSEERISKLELR